MSGLDDERTAMPPGPTPSTVVDDPGIAVTPGAAPSLVAPDAELSDVELEQEIELVSVLVLAASASSHPLSPAEIDQALGL